MQYLDIETTGLDPRRDEILTIQYQAVAPGGRPAGPLVLLKSWESDERTILATFIRESGFFDRTDPWAFFPTGFNLSFEYRFLLGRAQRHGIELGLPWDWVLNKPSLDLQPLAVLMNGGQFKGSSLQNFSRKPTSGHTVIDAVARRDWDAVETYVRAETAAFFELLQALHRVMPELWRKTLQPLVQGGETGRMP